MNEKAEQVFSESLSLSLEERQECQNASSSIHRSYRVAQR
jgi:hypothetical protein